MPVRLYDIARNLFRRPTPPSRPSPPRTRLALTPLEDRTVPAFVVVEPATVNDADEGGTDGLFRFTRTGDTTNALTVNYTVSGTATGGTDYTALTGTVTFPAGEATADVVVDVTADAIYDPDEEVTVEVSQGIGYVVGTVSTATLTIADNIDAVETLIYQQAFQLTGSSGNVDVVLTVTYNLPGAAGLYTWAYTVTNPSAGTTSWTNFSVPVSDMDTDVGSLTSTIGWTGTVGTSAVSWAGGTALAPGSTATFKFTTSPREVVAATITAAGTGGATAQLPTAPPPRPVAPGPQTPAPQASVAFFAGTQAYTIRLRITTASGQVYLTDPIPVTQGSAGAARDYIYNYLVNAGWAVDKLGADSLQINGVLKPDKTIDGVVGLTCTVTGEPAATSWPHASGTPNVNVINN